CIFVGSFFLSTTADHCDRHSFPTRRSSDLRGGTADTRCHAAGAEQGRGGTRTRSKTPLPLDARQVHVDADDAIGTAAYESERTRSEEHTSELLTWPSRMPSSA